MTTRLTFNRSKYFFYIKSRNASFWLIPSLYQCTSYVTTFVVFFFCQTCFVVKKGKRINIKKGQKTPQKNTETKTDLSSFFCCFLSHFLFIPHSLSRLEVPGAPCRLVLHVLSNTNCFFYLFQRRMCIELFVHLLGHVGQDP